MAFSVEFEEDHSSIVEERTRDGFSATMTLRCAWADRLTLRDEIVALPGWQYPHSPLVADCRAVHVSTVPFRTKQTKVVHQADPPVSLGSWDTAILTVRFQTPESGPGGRVAIQDPNKPISGGVHVNMISEEWVPVFEALAVPAGQLYMRDDTQPGGGFLTTPRDTPIQSPMGVWTYTRHNVAKTRFSAVDLFRHYATYNSVPIDGKSLIPGMNFDVDSLLMVEMPIEASSNSTGQRQFNLTFRMQYRRHGWRRFFNPKAKRDPEGLADPDHGTEYGAWDFLYADQGLSEIFVPYLPSNWNGVFPED